MLLFVLGFLFVAFIVVMYKQFKILLLMTIFVFYLFLPFSLVFVLFKSKQGRPPQESERGPYAVVDERCEDTTLDPSMKDLLQRQVLLISWTLV